jgi:RNA polymerase sigma factor (sigma-70 family)
MTALLSKTAETSASLLLPDLACHRRATLKNGGSRRRPGERPSAIETWRTRSEKWGFLMVEAQSGKRQAYEQLLRELDQWLRRYYAGRLPPGAADDARQEALLAIHINRYAYTPARPFAPWAAAIARYKLIDHLRIASRFVAIPLDNKMSIEDMGEAAINSVTVEHLLSQLKPAQAQVIRLVKLAGASIQDASNATGQSASLVKINIHRGLKKLAALVVDHW